MSLNPEGNLIKRKKKKIFLNSDSSGSDDNLSQQNEVQNRTVRLSQRRLSTPSKWDLALKKLREKRANSKAPKRYSQSGVGFGNSSGSGEDGNNCKVDSVDNRESMSDLQEELLSDNVVRSDLLSDSDVDHTELKGRLLLNGEEIDSVGGWNEFIHSNCSDSDIDDDKCHLTASTDDLSDFIDDSDETGTSTSSSNSSTSGISGDKPLETEYNIFIQYLMSLALDPTFKENKGGFYFEKVIKIENKLLDSQKLVKSQAWTTWFRTALENFPDLSFDNSASEGGNCEACKKPKRVASTVLRFSGRKYDWEKIERGEEENEEEEDHEMEQFDVGCHCMRRAHLYHNLYHLKYKLYQQCKSVISSFDDEKEESLIVNECLDDKFWVSKRYEQFRTLINNAIEFYTEDGRGQKPSSHYY